MSVRFVFAYVTFLSQISTIENLQLNSDVSSFEIKLKDLKFIYEYEQRIYIQTNFNRITFNANLRISHNE